MLLSDKWPFDRCITACRATRGRNPQDCSDKDMVIGERCIDLNLPKISAPSLQSIDVPRQVVGCGGVLGDQPWLRAQASSLTPRFPASDLPSPLVGWWHQEG